MPIYVRRQFKPIQGTQLNLGDDFCQGLQGYYALNEGSGGIIHDLVNGVHLTVASGYGSVDPWSRPGLYQALRSDANNEGASAVLPARLQLGLPLTFAIGYRAVASMGSLAQAFGVTYTNSDSSPYFCWMLESDGHLAIDGNSAGFRIENPSTTVSPTSGDHVLAGMLRPNNQDLYLDGVSILATTTPITTPNYTANSQISIGQYVGQGRNPNILAYWAAWWNRALSPEEHLELAQNPWRVFQSPQPYWLYKPSSGAVSGSLAVTLGSDTFTGSGALSTPATMAVTLGSDTMVGIADFATAASLGITLGSDTFVGSASFSTSASATISLGDDTFTGVAGSGSLGSMAVTLGSDTFAGLAEFSTNASAAITLGSDTFAGLAELSTNASATITLGDDTFVGSGAIGATASMVITLGADIFVGVAGGSTVPLIAYVDATRAVVVFEDSQVSEIDPTRTTVVQ